MEIHPGIAAVDLGLWLQKEKILILADFHLGFEEALNRIGVFVPRLQFKDTVKRLEKIFEQVKPEKIIINGDLKHEFGKISMQEWRDTLKVIDLLSTHCKQIVLVRGNHDTILGPIRNIGRKAYW